MTTIQRKLLLINGLLGLGITLSAAVADHFDFLRSLERWFYGRRAAYFQFFTPPPSDKLVFLDIDDNAVELERWPWSRTTWAEIVDEVSNAKPAAVFLDILFTEPQITQVPMPDGSVRFVDEDAAFAEAIKRAGNIMLPVSLDIAAQSTPSPEERALVELLERDLELGPSDAEAALKSRGIDPARGEGPFESRFVAARRDAMHRRISREMATGDLSAEQLRPRLLPRTDPREVSSPLLRLLASQFDKVERLKPLERFSWPRPADWPPLLKVDDETPPLARFGRNAGGSGYVNYLNDEDGVVRRIPLMAIDRDRVLPQIGMALACRLLDADPAGAKLTRNELIMKKRNGDEIVIPVRTRMQPGTKNEIGALMDIPYTGGSDWKSMFDPQKRATAKQHVPINLVRQILQTRQAIRINNGTIDSVIKVDMEGTLESSILEEFRNLPVAAEDTAARLPFIDKSLEAIATYLKEFATMTNLSEDEAKLLAALKRHDSAFRKLREENDRLARQLSTQRGGLLEKLEGRAILVGSIVTGAAAQDFKPTPIHDKCPGVVIHGAIANGILTGEMWRSAQGWVTRLLTILLGLTTTAFVMYMSPTRAAIATLALAGVYFAINGVLMFDYFNTIVGVAAPVVAMTLAWSSTQLVEMLVEQAERRRITRRFARYVDPMLVNYFLDHPESDVLNGQEREMTVVFTDLAGFTTISERLKEKVVPLLNDYLGLMAKVIRKHNGYVNKYLGDGIMFFYNAPLDNPNHATDAAATVLEMQEVIIDFNKNLLERGLPEITMRAGMTTGSMVVGDAGSPDSSDYTVLGDNVNLAARLEGANKATGTRTLMTARTAELLGDAYVWRPIAKLTVKGKSEGVVTCELIARAAEATPEQKRLAECTKAVFDCFVARRFDQCIDALDCLEREFGESKLSHSYRELAAEYAVTAPPAEFAGEIVLTEK